MTRKIPVSEAKARFSDFVHAAESGELIIITRHDKPVAALVRPENIEQLDRLRTAGPEGGLASLAGGWERSDDLLQIVAETSRTRYRIMPDSE